MYMYISTCMIFYIYNICIYIIYLFIYLLHNIFILEFNFNRPIKTKLILVYPFMFPMH